ncbi:uncharacterized protein PITG_07211 [Phytophthora infestans T30-4]|uniref:Uracil-DNA glycosylase-like domain-containing protein n=1 Tax=Phytophthora infestans (strain T30-4) TaxID=403677 RepID=D0N7I8_PHYIT|nr:uncharacterized protein PITG_07211 [Phytophthora infestans T30-4]EEY53537.1 conserved hypothetical protein [Phytophthora infestans T30-4]|eukprot:XP_002905155.1 conserved hypothetical protein [Phytophthora infestans T30-4]
MAGVFDRFRFGAKRQRSEDTADATPSWQERWHAICDDCFEQAQPCLHHPERRLRLLIVGHNPSDHAWKTGYSYSNPTNRMWMLLTGTLSPHSWEGIVPSTARIDEQNILPDVHGVGFTSIGLEPGNDASKYGKATMEAWRTSFFQRLRRHALPHAPILIAFSGKRQFSYLFSPALSKIESYGKQSKLPPGWPHELRADSEVWVLPSSSGRAAMTTAQRTLPYQQLAERLRQIPWGVVKKE